MATDLDPTRSSPLVVVSATLTVVVVVREEVSPLEVDTEDRLVATDLDQTKGSPLVVANRNLSTAVSATLTNQQEEMANQPLMATKATLTKVLVRSRSLPEVDHKADRDKSLHQRVAILVSFEF